MVPERLADLRGPKFQKFSALHADNRKLGRQRVSLIATLKHMKQTKEQMGPLYTIIYSSFFCLFPLCQASHKSPAGKAVS